MICGRKKKCNALKYLLYGTTYVFFIKRIKYRNYYKNVFLTYFRTIICN